MELTQIEKLKPTGRCVDLEDDGLHAYVFPVGFRHLTAFTSKVKALLSAIGQIKVPKGTKEEDALRILGLELAPHIIEHLSDLLKDTVVVCRKMADGSVVGSQADGSYGSLDDLQHWHVPSILEAWFDLSFGSQRKWKPWVQAVEKTIHTLTGKKVVLSETLSKTFSSPGIPDKTS
jgi:isochorismate synthase EntC